MEFDQNDFPLRKNNSLTNNSPDNPNASATVKSDLLTGNVPLVKSSESEHVKREAFKAPKPDNQAQKTPSSGQNHQQDDKAEAKDVVSVLQTQSTTRSNFSRGMSVSSALLEETEVQILTSLESYYPERPKPNPKDKKALKEFATNVDQPKDPKAIKIRTSFDRTANEMMKELKSKLRVHSNVRGGPLTNRGLARHSLMQGLGQQGFQSARGINDRRVSTINQPNQQLNFSASNQNIAQDATKDELRLYLFKTKAKNKMMAFKRLENLEFPLRLLTKPKSDTSYVTIMTTDSCVKEQNKQVYSRSGDALTRDNQYDFPYILCFVNIIQIQSYMMMYGVMNGMFGDLTTQQEHANSNKQQMTHGMQTLISRPPILNAMSNLIPRSLVSSAQWERKGKLKKKSSASEAFKERHFVLERDHLYYYKSERTKDKIFTCIILSNADIRMFSSDSPRGQQDPNSRPSYIKDKNYYVLEIENESRKYVLSAKSHFDLVEWFNAIYAQIESLNTNRLLLRNANNIVKKEQQIAERDKQQVKNLTKLQMITSNHMQPRLLEFVDEVLITELLPNVTKYMLFADKKDRKRALDKANEIIEKQLKPFHSRSQALLNNTMTGSQQKKHKSGEEAYKRYKTLPMHEKIACLVTADDLQSVCKALENMQKLPPDHEKMSANELVAHQENQIDAQLFQRTSTRIVRVLRYNYLPDFNRQELKTLTLEHTKGQPGLGFNSLEAATGALSLKDKPQLGKQTNIFGYLGQQVKEPKQFSAAMNISTPSMPPKRKTLAVANSMMQLTHSQDTNIDHSDKMDKSSSSISIKGQIKKVKDGQLSKQPSTPSIKSQNSLQSPQTEER